MYRFLLYLTNNLDKSMHEKEWDVVLFVLMTIAIIVSEYFLIFKTPDYGWAAGMAIWYLQAVDQIRFNREKSPVTRKVKITVPEPLSPKEEL